MGVGDELQGLHRSPGNRALAEQRDDMREDRGANRITGIEHTPNTLRVARLQRDDLQDVGVGATQIRQGGLLGHCLPRAALELPASRLEGERQ